MAARKSAAGAAAEEPKTEPVEATVTEGAAPEAPSLAEPASLGFAKVAHPAGATSASFDGVTYEADKDGNITVPLLAVEPLVSHGFALVG